MFAGTLSRWWEVFCYFFFGLRVDGEGTCRPEILEYLEYTFWTQSSLIILYVRVDTLYFESFSVLMLKRCRWFLDEVKRFNIVKTFAYFAAKKWLEKKKEVYEGKIRNAAWKPGHSWCIYSIRSTLFVNFLFGIERPFFSTFFYG